MALDLKLVLNTPICTAGVLGLLAQNSFRYVRSTSLDAMTLDGVEGVRQPHVQPVSLSTEFPPKRSSPGPSCATMRCRTRFSAGNPVVVKDPVSKLRPMKPGAMAMPGDGDRRLSPAGRGEKDQ
jgi:hypothetical protein